MINDNTNLLSQPRFQAPANWDWSFRTLKGIKIRYGQVRSRKIYKAVIVMFEGLGDFGEQYFELAHELEARDFKFIVIDPPGQGGSGRYLKNTHKRHSAGFDSDIEDYHTLLDDVVLSAAVDPEDNHKRLPCILLAHSMGGNFALRYLADYNKSSRNLPIFSCAALVCPMLGIKAVDAFPPSIAPFLINLMALRPTSYIPKGGNWVEGTRIRPHVDYILTSDTERGNIQNAYFANPAYQHLVIGSPTTKWLKDAVASCNILKEPAYLQKIHTPVLMAIAGQDALVSNDAIRNAAKHLPHAKLLEIPEAFHEILMESDIYRQQFLDCFFTFINENVLMKPDNGKLYIQ